MKIELLFGNKNIKRILFFILINRTCCASSLARHFNSPLTPIQSALYKLEKAEILVSNKEGKSHFFQFKPDSPFLPEFEALLRKAYTLLPADEKKVYYAIESLQKKQTLPLRRAKKQEGSQSSYLLNRVWKLLAFTTNLSFKALSQGPYNSGWNGEGRGVVSVKSQNDHALIFEESGSWISQQQQEYAFKNLFRWTRDPFKQIITLEHLRFGVDRPVFLFQLAPTSENVLESISSYICGEDSYLGRLSCLEDHVALKWKIMGPKKNEEIHYIYK